MTSKRFPLRISISMLLRTAVLPLAAFSAVPSQGAKPADAPIIVTGDRLPEKEQVRKLSRAITPYVSRDEAMPRFADPVCFITAGLPRSYLLEIANRLAIDAKEAGIALAGEKCRPNVAVLFVDNGAVELEQYRKVYPRLFGSMDAASVRAVIAQEGPAHAWWVSQRVSSDGRPMTISSLPGGASGLATVRVSTASMLVLPTRQDVQFAVITIDRSALNGLSLTQIADYAAMRTLGGARPAPGTGNATILGLFDGDATPPPELSAFDRAYLKTVYEGQGNLKSGTRMNHIVRNIIREGEKADTEQQQP